MSLVYCPRTHAYFEHEPYPLGGAAGRRRERRRRYGLAGLEPGPRPVGGMRYLHRRFGDAVAAADVLRMGTLAGATALGIDQDRGSLAPGKAAWLTIVPLPDGDARDPHELLFNAAGAVIRHPRATADLCGPDVTE